LRFSPFDRRQVSLWLAAAALTRVAGRLADDQAADQASHVLAISGVKPPVRHGSTLELTVDEGPRTVIEVLRALDGDGLSPTSVVAREPSLDDVFLALTGQRTTESDEERDGRGAA
jgi:ABC-2 type transport system ATP-binding protein